MQIHGHTGTINNLIPGLEDVQLALRWGGPKVQQQPGHPPTLNGQVDLLTGLQQLQAMQAAEVGVPAFTTDLRVAQDWVAMGAIVLGRTLHHTQGRDIVLPSNRLWAQRDFWVKYIPAITSEWRLHILKNKCIARGKKVFEPTATRPRERAPGRNGGMMGQPIIVRSRRLGWRIDHSQDPPEGLRTLARSAVKACKYDLGAVDCVVLEGGQQLVLEVNSRPAIRDPYTIGQYTKYLRNFAAGGGRIA